MIRLPLAVAAALVLLASSDTAAQVASGRPKTSPVRKPAAAARTPPRAAVPLVADASEIPPLEETAKAPGPWDVHLLPECARCTFPAWPSSPDGQGPLFRMHVVVQEDGSVGAARIVKVLRGDPAARPIGIEGRVAAPIRETLTAKAGLAALEAVRQWRFERPYDAPLLMTIDFGSDSPQPARERADGQTLRAGTDVPAPDKRVDVRPVYPPEAIQARITGTVIIRAVIGPGGDVESAQVVRGNPMLDEAALTAVRQWKYAPTLIKGEPVPVEMTVTVTFSLSR